MNASNILLLIIVVQIVSINLAFEKTQNVLSKSKIIHLNGSIGPESVAFDPNGEGPYIGVADGRILKLQLGSNNRLFWAEFAVTSSHRRDCTSPFAPKMEHICGRPLGLRFDTKTGELYIADAYLGLQVVGPKGGLATPLVQKFEGKPLVFTNDVDIDDDVIYFTDTSTKYQRWQFLTSFSSGDTTGRLMKYDKSTKKVTVLLGDLAFANGVALSKNKSFVLVTETTNFRILRYWLKGPLVGTHDVFVELPGFPDNIRINPKGEFWVALQAIRSAPSVSDSKFGMFSFNPQQMGDEGELLPTALKLSEDGRVLEVLEDVEGKTLRSISEIEEKDGKLWIGSVVMPFLRVYEM
ncbi:protein STRICTOSIDINE SYNTHASE-LIKE 10-like [Solanum pennellii]|uniref:Protein STRICTOSIDINE SYNTHASE-LIKE 10-like n=1 Tax=Solanum pennellii TaxID=28526 RepID=A0ABM1H9R6_SOLPN|nr:protein STRICTOSIDINE SYNTHASE-LIKE 10-like [Solanum pennellii]